MKLLFSLVIFGILPLSGCGSDDEESLGRSMASLPDTEVAIQSQGVCITTAGDYINALKKCQPVTCVDPGLFGVVTSKPKGTPVPTSLHPEKYQWAWVAGYNNLELYTAWQKKRCNDESVTKNILAYVGFGKEYIKPDYDYYLSVMDLSDEKTLFVPSFESWFHVFEKQFDLNIPLTVQKEIILSNNQGTGPNDPTTNFVDVTGCEVNAALNCSDSAGSPGEGCGPAYAKIAEELKHVSPPMNSGTTKECVNEFIRYTGSAQPQAAEVRALLNYCVDANPCNTGLGLGFNPSYVSDVSTNSLLDHYTGREFVLQNKTLADVQAQTIKLPGIK